LFLEKRTENFVTAINSKFICKEIEMTVTFRRSKPNNIVVVKVASWSTVLPEQRLWHHSQPDGRRNFWDI